MAPSDRNPLSIFGEVASTFAGRFVLFGLVLLVGSMVGCGLGFEEWTGPGAAFVLFVGSGLKTALTGGWGVLAYPLLLLGQILYLRFNLSHHLLWFPGLVSTAFTWHLSSEIAASSLF